MKTIKTVLKCSFCSSLALILVSSAAAGAYGTTLKIKPDRLKKVISAQEDLRWPFLVASNMQNVNFYYPLKLPAGTRIRGMDYQHGGGTVLTNTTVSLMRVKADASPALQLILQGRSTENTGSGLKLVWIQADFDPGAVRRVKKGWTYYVFVEIGEESSFVGDIKVFYQ
jgi:hypothetical protein